MTNSQLERFLSHIEHVNGCWQWIAKNGRNGYGHVKIDRKTRLAHRVSYEHFVGDIPEGLEIDHLCRNRACVNPMHLEAVGHRTNVIRGLVPIVSSLAMAGNTIWLGRKHSERTKARMAASAVGRTNSPQHCANMSAARRGVKLGPCSPETKAKLSAAKMGVSYGPLSDDHRAKVSAAVRVSERAISQRRALHEANKGSHRSEETRAKMSASAKAAIARRKARAA